MEFKVVLDVDGETVEMVVLFAGATVNVEFFKEGKSVKKYEQLPVEILSKLSSSENVDEQDEDDDTEDAPVIDLTEDYDEEEYENVFENIGDLDQFIVEAAENIECKQLVNRLKPICSRNFSTLESIVSDLTNAFNDPEYDPAVMSLKSGLEKLSSVSGVIINGLGGSIDDQIPGSKLLYGRIPQRRRRRHSYQSDVDIEIDVV